MGSSSAISVGNGAGTGTSGIGKLSGIVGRLRVEIKSGMLP
jgi:hypothetical protein